MALSPENMRFTITLDDSVYGSVELLAVDSTRSKSQQIEHMLKAALELDEFKQQLERIKALPRDSDD